MSIKRMFAALSAGLLFLSCCCLTAHAETELPEGAVKGLPERLSVLDSEGVSPNAKGEYFFHVENMTFGETYTKKIQIMNLREDKAYHIYFYVEPIAKSGEIDLEKEVECTMTLGGAEVFRGNVNGIGNLDLTKEPLDLGLYQPGDTNTLTCSVVWNGLDGDVMIDEGARLVDKKGVTILRDKNGDRYVEGEITYRWIFYAAVDEDIDPPYTGLLAADGKFWLACIAGAAGFLLIAALLVLHKRRKERNAQ